MVPSIVKVIVRASLNKIRYEPIVNLDKSQWWPLEKLEKFQNYRLKKIIRYAYRYIPGYREKMRKTGIKPGDIQTKSDLQHFPITTREELQDNELFINRKRIQHELKTGGSTGMTLKYYDSYESANIRMGAHIRGWTWNGYRFKKDRLAVISSAQGIVNNEHSVNYHGDLTSENLRKNVESLIQYQPEYLRGYVTSIYILAKYCEDHNVRIPSIKSINTISENLYDYQRELIERVFHASVFEEYCCNDGGACAWECDTHEGLHYVMERAVIEELNGEILVTDLWNRAMPFIRYQNGDSVTFLNKTCGCGRELPLIKVKGRTNDILITPQGPVSPTFLMHHGSGQSGADQHLDNNNSRPVFRSGIREVQYIQKPNYLLEINLVRNEWCTENELIEFKSTVQRIVGDMEITVNYVNALPTTPKGKRQFIINEDNDLLEQWKGKGTFQRHVL